MTGAPQEFSDALDPVEPALKNAATAGPPRMKFRQGSKTASPASPTSTVSPASSPSILAPNEFDSSNEIVDFGAESTNPMTSAALSNANDLATSLISSGDTLSTDSDSLLATRENMAVPSAPLPITSLPVSNDSEAQANTVFSPIFDDSQGAPADKKNKKALPTPLPEKARTSGGTKTRTSKDNSKDMASFMRSSGMRPAQVAPGTQAENGGEGPDIVPASGPSSGFPGSAQGFADRFQAQPRYLVASGPSLISKAASKFGEWYAGFTGMINSWVESAAGYDEKIIESFGTPTDEKRRRNIGRAIVVATLVGSLGWLVKISLAMPAPYGVIVGLIISGLYGVLSYSLESFFAANVNPFAPLWSKCLSLLGRSLLSALIAFSGALPWVTMSLKGSIHLEMAKIAQTEQLSMRQGIDKVHGLSGLGARSTALQSELSQWNDSLANLPASVTAVFAQADRCEAQSLVLKQDTVKREADLSLRLVALAKQESAARGDARKISGINNERKSIAKRGADLEKSLVDQRAQCTAFRVSANEARDEHMKMAALQRQSAMTRLSKQRDVEQAELSVAQQDTLQADKVTKLALSENSAGEFTALVSLIKNQFYAQFLGLLIFTGLFMVDVLPLTLRLFARPGPYDVEKRADDAIRMMRAEGRQMQAELIHSARQSEITSDEFRAQVQQEVRPHIRSIALNDVSRFIAKQRNVA